MNTGPSFRRERVATAIKQHLADALATRVKDPRVGLVSITRVTVSADLSHASVLVSILGNNDEKKDALDGLESARGFLRSILARHLRSRTVPELHFEPDRGLDHAARMYDVLDRVKEEGLS